MTSTGLGCLSGRLASMLVCFVNPFSVRLRDMNKDMEPFQSKTKDGLHKRVFTDDFRIKVEIYLSSLGLICCLFLRLKINHKHLLVFGCNL
jgi:hypothetical protein